MDLIALAPILASAVTWLLSTGIASADLVTKIQSLKSTKDNRILVKMASDEQHKKSMEELYQSIETSRPLADTLLKKRRKRALVIGASMVVLFTIAWGLIWWFFVQNIPGDMYIYLAIVTGIYLGGGRGFFDWQRARRLTSSIDFGIDIARKNAHAAATLAKKMISEGQTEIRKLSPTELEEQFLGQFFTTVGSLQQVESVLLINSLADGGLDLRSAYKDQIAKRIASKLESVLLEPENIGINDAAAFAEVADAILEDLGYKKLVPFTKSDIEDLVTQEVIRSYREEEPKYLVKRIKRWKPLLGVGQSQPVH